MRFKKWLSTLLALCLLVTMPSVLSEGLEIEEEPIVEEFEDIVLSEDVDNAAEEEDFMLFSDEPLEKGYSEFLIYGDANLADVPIDEEHFPDDVFRAYTKNFDTNNDGVLSESERESVTIIDVQDKNIASLQGIQFFPALNLLNCRNNLLNSLDVSGCESLQELDCGHNKLTSLILCDSLVIVHCAGNYLSNLDVSGNTALWFLECSFNLLTNLDVRGCSGLENLFCHRNQLDTLNLDGCPIMISCARTEPILRDSGELEFSIYEDVHCRIDCDPLTTLTAGNETLYSFFPTGEQISGKCGDNANFLLNSDGVLNIYGSGDMWDFLLLDSDEADYHMCPWENRKNSIVEVVFQPGITGVGRASFFSCNNLTKVVFSDTITYIEDFAFSYCHHLGNFTLPTKLEYIGQEVFRCTNITKIDIPESVSHLGAMMCGYCDNLRSVTIRAYKGEAFRTWSGLFENCPSLQSIDVESEHSHLHSHEGVLYCQNLLIEYPVGKKDTAYRIEKGCTEIMRFAFYNCYHLQEISFPETMAIIDSYVFDGCISLKCVNYAGTESDWNRIRIGEIDNDPLFAADRHYGITEGYETPTPTPTAKPTATPTAKPTATPTQKPMVTATPSPAPTFEATPIPTEQAPEKVSISNCDITVKDKTYTGKALKPAVTVTYNGTLLTKGTDYTVSYKNNTKVGTATVTVTGKGKYTGSKKATFKIKPKGTTLSKLTGGKKKITVKWNKQNKQVSGYQIQYGTKKDLSNAKKVTVKGAKTVKKVIKSLKAKKTYYVRIRTYKTVGKKKYYSSWSKSKKVKTK